MKKTKEQIMLETEQFLADDAAIIGIYERVLKGELRQFPNYTWELPNSLYYAEILTRYLFERKLNWSLEDIKKNLSNEVIIKHRLRGMKRILFKDLFSLVNNAYPNQIKPWELNKVAPGYWKSDENKRDALKWFFEEKLQWSLEDIKEKLTYRLFQKNGWNGLIKELENSPYKAVDFLYPNQIKPWELAKASQGYWKSDENKEEALKWLFEEKLQWSLEDVKEKLTKQTFEDNGLSGLIQEFDSSPYKVVNFLYPNQIKPWDLIQVSHSYWKSDENKKETLKWLFEEKLNWSMEDIKENLSLKTFENNGLSGFIQVFGESPYKALNFLYPNKIEPWELQRVGNGFWKSDKNKKEALKWLFEKKLNWNSEVIKSKLTIKTFQDNGLNGLIQEFDNSPRKVLKFLYPNEEFEN